MLEFIRIQTVSSWLFFSTNLIYGGGAASFALLMSCIFHSPGAATKGTAVIWLATIGELIYFNILNFQDDFFKNYTNGVSLISKFFINFILKIFAGLTRLKAAGGSVLLNIILSLNLNYAFICAHHAMQDYMNRGNWLTFGLLQNIIPILCI